MGDSNEEFDRVKAAKDALKALMLPEVATLFPMDGPGLPSKLSDQEDQTNYKAVLVQGVSVNGWDKSQIMAKKEEGE